MAFASKNQRGGRRGNLAEINNKKYNGGLSDCLPKYNAANVGAQWKVKMPRSYWEIKSKKRTNW